MQHKQILEFLQNEHEEDSTFSDLLFMKLVNWALAHAQEVFGNDQPRTTLHSVSITSKNLTKS